MPIPCITDLSTVFSTFDIDKWLKIRRHEWKEPLQISEPAKFSIAWDQAPRWGMGGGGGGGGRWRRRINSALAKKNRPPLGSLNSPIFSYLTPFFAFSSTAEPSPRLSFQMIALKRAKVEHRKVAKIYRRLYGGGGGGQIIVPHHTNVCKFRDSDELYLRKFSTNLFKTWQFYLFKNFFFSGESMDFP